MDNETIFMEVVVQPRLEGFLSQMHEASKEASGEVSEMLTEQIREVGKFRTAATGSALEDAPDEYKGYLQNLLAAVGSQVQQIVSDVKGMQDSQITSAIRSQIETRIKTTIGQLMQNIIDGTFSVNAMKGVMGSIQKDATNAFASSYRDFLMQANKVIGFQSRNPTTDQSWTKYLELNKGISAGAQAMAQQFGLQQEQMRSLTRMMVMHQPAHLRTDFQKNATTYQRGAFRQSNIPTDYLTYQERLPELYRNLSDQPQPTRLSNAERRRMSLPVSTKEWQELRALAARNQAFEDALVMAGIAKRTTVGNKAGVLAMPEAPVSRLAVARTLGHLHQNILIPALEGSPSNYTPISKIDQTNAARKNSTPVLDAIGAFREVAHMGISPYYVAAGQKQQDSLYRRNPHLTMVEGARTRALPEQYQIMSLTLSDFLNGRVLDPRGEVQHWTEEDPRGVSVNKIIRESGLTRMLGMSGNNTFGNGSKTDTTNRVFGTKKPTFTSNPVIIEIDMSNDLLQKDAGGDLEWGEDGLPKQNMETRQRIANMFTVPKGQKHARIQYGTGDFSHYVPSFVKNGVVMAIREDAYEHAVGESERLTGHNILANMADPNTIYETLEQLNKTVEAQNRILTPQVPIERMNGKLPATNRIAFVDMKSITGHDGQSFFMPGFIPGENATYRFAGQKGVAQTVDFRAMIRDLFGEQSVDGLPKGSFYLPSIAAPKEYKELFASKGLSAVRTLMKERGEIQDFDKYFLDIMQYDALITDSVLKSPAYRGLTNKEAQYLFDRIQQTEGRFSIAQTADQFLSQGHTSLGRQGQQFFRLNPEQIQENKTKWERYINELRFNPDKAIEYLFSDESDSVASRIRQNKGDLWKDREAVTRINNEIARQQLAMMNNEVFSRGMSPLALAVANPGNLLLQAGRMNNLQVADQDLARVLALGPNMIAAGFLDEQKVAGARWPMVSGEQYSLDVSPDYLSRAQKYGLANNVVYINTDTIGKMGGGDVDGDTIQLMRKSLHEYVVQTLASMDGKTGQRNPNMKPNPITINRSATGEDMADQMYRKAAQNIVLGIVSRQQDALAQLDWDDPEVAKRYGQANASLAQLYDIDSTYLKTGVLGDFDARSKEARYLGRPFSHALKAVLGAVQTGDYSGVRKMQELNFPSRYHALTVSMLESLYRNPINNAAMQRFIAAQRDVEGIDALRKGEVFQQRQADFLEDNIRVMQQLYLSQGTHVSMDDYDSLMAKLNTWSTALEQEAAMPGASEERKKMFEENRRLIYSQRARLRHLMEFGVLEGKQDGYMSYLDGTRATQLSQPTSVFNAASTEAEQEEEQLRLAQAIAVGANPVVLQGMQTASYNDRVAARKDRAKNTAYSFSQLKLLHDNPSEWWQRYVQGTQGVPTDESHIGNVADMMVQEWAERKWRIQQGQKNERGELETMPGADWFEKMFVGLFTGQFDPREFLQGMKPDVAARFKQDAETLGFTNGMVPPSDRYMRALGFTRNLPNFMQDQQIATWDDNGTPRAAYQRRVSPNMGVTYEGQPIQTVGYVDLQTIKDGKTTAWDLKPHFNQGTTQSLGWKGIDQLHFYAADPSLGADQIGIIAYADAPELGTMQTQQINKEHQDRVMAAMRAQLYKRLDYAEHADELDYVINGRQTPQEEQKEAAEQREKALRATHDANRPLLDRQTGMSMAKAMALQNDITQYEERLGETAHQLMKRGFRYSEDKYNPWEQFSEQLDTAFNRTRDRFIERGANEEDLAQLYQARQRAQEQYDTAIRAAITGKDSEVQQGMEKIRQITEGNKGDTGLAAYIRDFEAIQEAAREAQQAVNQFSADIQKRKDAGEVISEQDEKTLEAGKQKRDEMLQLATSSQYNISRLASERANDMISKLETPEMQTIRSRSQIAFDRMSEIGAKRTQISKMLDAKMIQPEEAVSFFDRLNALSSEDQMDSYIRRELQNDRNRSIIQRQQNTLDAAKLRMLNGGQGLSEDERRIAYQQSYRQQIDSLVRKGFLTRKEQQEIFSNIGTLQDAYANRMMEAENNKQEYLDSKYTASLGQIGIRAASMRNRRSAMQRNAYSMFERTMVSSMEQRRQNVGNFGNILSQREANAAELERVRTMLSTEQNEDGTQMSDAQRKAAQRQLGLLETQDWQLARQADRAARGAFLGKGGREKYESAVKAFREQQSSRVKTIERQGEIDKQINELKNKGDNRTAAENVKLAKLRDERRQTETQIVKEEANMAKAERDMQGSPIGQAFAGGLDAVAQSLSRLGAMLGRRLFQSAIREATQFVKVYDQTMHQIQAITMKSDNEMVSIRQKTIEQAISWKTSASNVAQVKSDLYRQGLSDSEVDRRAEAIVKFSTVTGAKVTQATKALTTAIQSGLVDSVEEAMDALTALGDSAATTAEEIFKGMQKSAAAASVAGVSYAELTSMLTVITSKTQLGGAQAGTALQTLFSRMRRVTNAKMVTDETGESTSLNDVEESLNRVGIQMRTDNTTFRGTTEILRDLAKVWNDLNDVQKNNIMYNMAGARQANMFSALMEGLADENGQTFDEYLGLAENSEGTTQSKYEIVIESINAQINELKQTFDGLVESIGSNGLLQGALDWITNIVTGFTEMSESSGPVITALAAIGIAVAALAAKFGVLAVAKEAAWGGLAAAAAVIGVLAVAGIGFGIAGNDAQQRKESAQTRQNKIEQEQKVIDYITSDANKKTSRVEDAIEKVNELNDKNVSPDTAEFQDAMKELELSTKAIGGNIGDWQNGVKDTTEAINEATEATKKYNKERAMYSLRRSNEGAKSIEADLNDTITKIQGNVSDGYFTQNNDGSYSINGVYGNGLFDNIYENNANFTVDEEQITYDFLKQNEDNTSPLIEKAYRKMAKDIGIEYTGTNRAEIRDKYFAATFKGFYSGLNTGYRKLNAKDSTGMYEFLKQNSEKPGKFVNTDTAEQFYDLWMQAGGIGLFSEADQQLLDQYGFYGGNWKDFMGFYKGISDDKQRKVAEIFNRNWNSQNVISQMAEQSQKNQSIIDAAIMDAANEMFTSDEAYGSALSLVFGSDGDLREAMAKDYVAKMQEEGKEVNAETAKEYAMSAVENYDSSQIGALARRYKKASDYDYYLTLGGNKIGLSGIQKQDVITAFEEQKMNEAEFTPFEIEGKTFSQWDDLINWANTSYDEKTADNIFTKTGLKINGNIGEILGQVPLTAKDLGFVQEYAQLFSLASKANDVASFLQSGGGMQNLLAIAQSDKQLTQMIQGLETGAYSLDDVKNYLATKVYGQSKSAYQQQNISTAEQIAKNNLDVAALTSGKASDATYKRVAQSLGLSETYVRGNAAAAAALLSSRNTEQENQMLQQATQIIANQLGGYGTFESVIAAAQKMREENKSEAEIQDQFKDWGLTFENGEIVVNKEGSKAAQLMKQFTNENQMFAYENGRLTYKGTEVTGREDLMNYSPVYTPEELNRFGAGILSDVTRNPSLSWNKIAETYDENKLRALQQQNPDLYNYLMLDNKQRQSQYGQNLKRKIDTQFEVQGISELEEAGKILSGTADTVSRLKSEGVISLEVELEIHNKAYASGQNLAKLFNGDIYQQSEAAMAILGMTPEEFQGDISGNILKAQQYWRNHSSYDAASWLEEYNAATSDEQRERIKADARMAGFIIENNGPMQWNQEKGYATRTASARAMTDKEIEGLGIDTTNQYTLMKRQYTDKEKADLMARALNGEDLTPDEWTAITGASQEVDAYLQAKNEWETTHSADALIRMYQNQNKARRAQQVYAANADQAEWEKNINDRFTEVQNLEAQGQLEQGTTAALKNLTIGGDLAENTMQDLQNKAWEEAMTTTMLLNGSRDQQIEAAAKVLNKSVEQVQQNADKYIADAITKTTTEDQETLDSLMKEREAAIDKTDFDKQVANMRGYKWNDEAKKYTKMSKEELQKLGINLVTDMYDNTKRFTEEQKKDLFYKDKSKSWNSMVSSGKYTKEELEAIKSYDSEYYEYLNWNQTQQASDQGRAIERRHNIKMTVEGLSDLEYLGELAEGTADNLAKMKQNDTIKLKVQTEISQESQQLSQLDSKWYNGTLAEKKEVARSLGFTEEQIETNWSAVEAMVNADLTNRNAQSIQQMNTYLDNQQILPQDLWKYGFRMVVPEQELIDKYNATGEIPKGFRVDQGFEYPYKLERIIGEPYRENPFNGLNDDRDQIVTARQTNQAIIDLLTSKTSLDNLDWHVRNAVFKTGEDIQRWFLNPNDSELSAKILRDANIGLLNDKVERGLLSSSAVSLYSGFTSVKPEEQQQAEKDLLDMLYKQRSMNTLISDIEEMRADEDQTRWNLYGGSAVQQLGQLAGVDEAIINEYQKPENYRKIMEEAKKQADKISTDVGALFENLAPHINLSSFDSIDALYDTLTELQAAGDTASTSLMPVVALLSALGFNLTGGKFTSTQTFTSTDFENFFSGDKDTWGKKLASLGAITSVLGIDNANMSYNDFLASYIGEGKMFANKEDAQALFDNTGTADLFAQYREGSITFEQLQNGLAQNQAYKAITKDNGYSYNLALLDRQFAPGGTYRQGALEELVAAGDPTGFIDMIGNLEWGKKALDEFKESGTITEDTIRRMSIEMRTGAIAATQWGDATEDAKKYLDGLNGSSKDVASTMKTYNQTLGAVLKNQRIRENWRKGARSGKNAEEIAGITGFDKKQIESGKFNNMIEAQLDAEEIADMEAVNAIGDAVFNQTNEALQDAFSSKTIQLEGLNIETGEGSFTFSDLGEVKEKLGAYLTQEQQDFIAMCEQAGIEAQAILTSDAAGNISIQFVTKSLGKGQGGGGGGGGGGKSAAQKLLEELKRKDSEADHRLKMLQYEETRYENAGELTNVNSLILQENKLREDLNIEYEENIKKLKEQMATTKKDTDDWYSLRDAILAYEEKIKESNNAIEENNRKIEENKQQIRKLRIALEQQLDQEIKNRIQRERDMLAGTVDMQNTILDSIKSRYEEEWKLVQKDIDKKKSALEEEKNLIDERLNKRKEAEDEAQKYEELAELRRQYALISMDSTRTKDATEIRKKITDTEKELAYASAEDEAKARQKSLDEQISAYDKYVSNGEEDLQVLLDNANNFADEMNQVIGMKDTELYDWLKENVTQYAKSVNEAQKQILLSWKDTYNQMEGIIETYWDNWKDIDGNEYEGIYSILEDKDKYLDFMKQSQDYIHASFTDQASMMYEWGKAYDDWINALKTGAFWEHFDEWMEALGLSSTSGSGGNQKKEKPDAILTKDALTGNDVHNEVVRINSDMLITEVGTGQVVGSVQTKPGVSSFMEAIMESMKNIPHNANGGLVDYTGLAWVDGSLTKPEAFLSAADTELMRNMLDAASYLAFRPTISNIDGNAFGKGGINMGDINITITEASFKEDADYERVAERVGDAFVRQLNKQGLNMANYSFG